MACAMPPSRTHIFNYALEFCDPGVIPLLAFGVLFTLLGELKATAANLPSGRPPEATLAGRAPTTQSSRSHAV